jgi:hypothetical protein
MTMHRVATIRSAFLLLGVMCVAGAQEQSRRDLDAYADGGSYELSWAARGEDQLEKMKGKARDFIWEHWRRKRAARISIRDATIYPEGPDDSITYIFYVEPDRNGGWQLTEEFNHYVSARLNGGEAENGKGAITYSQVERIKAGDVSDCPALLSGRPELYPKTYRLRLTKSQPLKDKSVQPCAIL